MNNEQDVKEHVEYLHDNIPRSLMVYYSKLVVDPIWESDLPHAFISMLNLRKFNQSYLEIACS